MNYYRIAGIHIYIEWENQRNKESCYRYHDCYILPRLLGAFQVQEVLPYDMRIQINERKAYGSMVPNRRIGNQGYREEAGKKYTTIFDWQRIDQPGYTIECSEDYSDVKYIPHMEQYCHYDLQWIMYSFEGRMLYHGGVILHGAAIEFMGQSVIFTGISGAGKTTQAHLWQRFRNAFIINGDCPAIVWDNEVPTVSGTPWCGTSGEAMNRKTPLKAVILVKKGRTNTVRKLVGNEAMLALLSNILRSNFDEAALNKAIENAQLIARKIEVFEFTACMNEEAVEVIERAIFSYGQ